MGTCHGGVRLDRGDGIDFWGRTMGSATPVVSGIDLWGMRYGRLTLAGSGDGIASWGHAIGACDTGWIEALGLIHGGLPWGHTTLAGSGQWDWFMAVCGTGWNGVMGLIREGLPRGHATVAGSGQWDWFMVVCGIGWNGVKELIHGGLPWGHVTLAGSGWWDLFVWASHGAMQHWLDRGDGIDSKGRAMGASDPGWIGAMVSIDGVSRHWLDWGDGIDLWGCVTLDGTGRWHWFMGTRLGDAWLDRGDGIDFWGHAMEVRHWMPVGYGLELWEHAMGACNWIRVMEWICGGRAMGRTTLTKSVRWDRFMWARNGGTRHWLDRGDVIDSWGHAKWQSTIWLLNLDDDTMCPHVWRWGKCA